MEVVSFEIAKKLKEKGFKEKVNAYYGKHENIFDVHPALDMNDADYRASAPTISQVLKWLREEKKIHIIVEIADGGWYYTIYPNIRWEDGKLKSDKYIMSCKNKSSFELAVLAGIEYVLDNLI